MTVDTVKSYYISGLHALRSASEQGAAAAAVLQHKDRNTTLHQIMVSYGETAKRHEAAITAFLEQLGETPNDFKDRVMEGVGNGMNEMLKAAMDESVMDLAVISASQTGIHYFHHAFAGQPDMAKSLGLADQANQWAEMAQEWQVIKKRLADVAAPVLKTALSA